ncbi:MAG: alpha-ribazole phosphatase family protein [Rhodocyclaceae bacterium]|nr:alpha-ribazole phosphatase family protein [Rhodocyclaceae bacterium]MDZ4214414.1 alpha-ribazole phosphatase family protein [Rhodocyclaceae bacterium]
MRLWLIRHPPPAVAAGTCYGATDLPLVAHPAELADRLRRQLPTNVPLYASPLQRCRRLAEQLHPQPRFDERLREIDFGDWEMQPWDQLDRGQLDAWAADPFNFVPPGGEGVAALRARVRAFLDELTEEAVLVVHAGVIKVCAAELAGETDWFGLRFDYGSITLIENGVWQPICAAQSSVARDKCHNPADPSR